MKTLRPFRWLIPRFSLSNLLMLMVVVGLSLAWYDQRRKLGEQAEAIEKQRLEITRLTVGNVLRSDQTDAEKVKALEPFVKLGDPLEKVLEWSKDRPLGYGTQAWSAFDLGDCGLCVVCEQDKINHSIGQYQANGDARVLATLVPGGFAIPNRYHP